MAAAEKEEQRMHAQRLRLKKVIGMLRVLRRGLDRAPMVALAFALGVACTQGARAQTCYDYAGHSAPTADYSWAVLDEALGGNNGRVLVVVDHALYFDNEGEPDPTMVATMATYVADLVTDGYSYKLAAFAGSVTELRNEIRNLYYETGVSLDGAVLVGGGLPWATYPADTPAPIGIPYPFEAYLMDLDEDQTADWQEDPPGSGQLHFWPGGHKAQIWVSRIKADNLPENHGRCPACY
jgi:hypothetical protein